MCGQGTGNREQGTGNTGRKTELIPTESCMATPRKLSQIKYYSYNNQLLINNYQLSIVADILNKLAF
ncbi:hypothetical protein [Dolichospermum circinale]|uniref:hypothetical protein n=1 Tax=Dolichospermum circinale TaxID=109265 RepID=UPI0003FA6E12|nr:hypothetical protein [Dolichospermum circinale]